MSRVARGGAFRSEIAVEERNRRSGKPLSLLESRMARIAQNARKHHNGASESHQLMLTLSQRRLGRLAEPPSGFVREICQVRPIRDSLSSV
jgi:hypothetical protein